MKAPSIRAVRCAVYTTASLVARDVSRAFSSEVDTGSREENASKQSFERSIPNSRQGKLTGNFAILGPTQTRSAACEGHVRSTLDSVAKVQKPQLLNSRQRTKQATIAAR